MKTTNANVLVTAVGGIVSQGIIKCLKLANASNDSPVNYRIIATDACAQAAGLYRCDQGILIPPASSPNYINSIINISREFNIHAIYAGSDEELVPLANAKKQIENQTGAKVLTNPKEVIIIARDKWKTFQFLRENNLPSAASSVPEDSEEFIREFGFPVVVKPREGFGSKYFYIVNDKAEMKYAICKIQNVGWNAILQEYINDSNNNDNTIEFTSGVTIDASGKSIMSSISIKKIIKNGQTYKAFIDSFESVRRSAEEVALRLGAVGAVNIQGMFTKKDQLKVFEINPRFSATCPMRSVAGVNEPDIIFRNTLLHEDIEVRQYRKLVCMRYWNEVYVQYATYEKTSTTGKVENGNDNSFVLNYF
ncbi:MAG TPA: ATP-grasp domain-containing protein [Nitrososphaeraceae archaeon]|nr:ATP-grasp domain-containing protein [Nitrososphaeraceae archaeon]